MAKYRMAPGDAAWLRMDRPTNPLIVPAVLWFDGPVDQDAFAAIVGERLVGRFPRFRQKAVPDGAGRLWWIDDEDFDLDRHVYRTSVVGGHDALMRFASSRLAEPLPDDRPLWRMHLVDGLTLDGAPASAVVAFIHHCVADGMALFRVLMSLTDAPEPDPAPVAPPSPDPSPVERLRRAGRAARALAGLVGMPPDARTALRRPLGTTKTLVWSGPIPLGALKDAARRAGGTVNDLVLAALSGGVEHYLAGIGGPVRDVRAVLPVNLRPPSVHVPVELGNLFGLVFLRLPVTAASAAERIRLVQRRTAALKGSLQAFVALRLIAVIGRLPQRLVQLVVTVFSAKGSAIVTNVKGPDGPVHLAGTRVAGVVAWPPQSGSIGLGVSVISCAGQVVVGVMADDRSIRDPRRMLADTCAGLRELGVLAEATAVA